jgi:hypothetical protein
VALDELSLLAWDDTRNGDEVSQTQDIYATAVQYEPVGSGTPRAAQFALAVASGLGLFGAVLFVVAAAKRKRSSP